MTTQDSGVPAVEACCASVQDGYGHHAGCENAPLPVRKNVDALLVDEAAVRYARTSAVENLLDTIEATTQIELTTQEELLTALDEMLDNSVHSEECYVNPDDTVCFCLIGKVRAVLPKCAVHQLMAFGRPWRCTRTAHPASPDRHVFGEV